MGADGGNQVETGIPSEVGEQAIAMAMEAQSLDGAVIVYDASDQIVWVNRRQRQIMPCSDYVGETYTSLFWKVVEAGMTGNPMARQAPAEFLALIKEARRTNDFLSAVNRYPWGAMVTTNRRAPTGWTLQLRFDAQGALPGLETPEALLMGAIRAQRDAAAARHALNEVDHPVAIIGDDGRRLFANAAFAELIHAKMGLTIVAGIFQPINDGDLPSWQRMLRDATGIPVFMHSLIGKPTMAVSATRGVNPGTLIVLATPCGDGLSRFQADHIARLLGVTQAQAEVLGLLADGRLIKEIAALRDTTEDTTAHQLMSTRKVIRAQGIQIENQVQLVNFIRRIAAITRAQ